MKYIFLKFISFIMIFTSIIACQNQEYEFPADYYIKLHGNIKRLEHLRSQLQSSFDFNLKTFQDKLKSEIPNFGALSWSWKAKSGQFKNELEKMKIEGVNLKKVSLDYFEKLKSIETKIRDYDLRKIENEANLKHKNDWLNLEKAILGEIDALELILDKSDDIFKVIVNAGNRQKPENPLKVFREMQAKVKIHFNKLKVLLTDIKTHVSVPIKIKKS